MRREHVLLCFVVWLVGGHTGTSSAGEKSESVDGDVLRIAGLDLREPGAEWTGDGRWEMVRERHDGRDCYCLQIKDRRFEAFTDWSVSARNTLPLKPNRNYVVSALLKADFERPAEVNLGLKMIDAGGKQVIWNLNGLPNQTNRWTQWQWEFTTDPRATHGVFSMLLMRFPRDTGKLWIADVAFIERPELPPPVFKSGEGATFRGGPGALPMRVEDAQVKQQRIVVVTTGAEYVFDLAGNTITASQRIETPRKIATWVSSLSFDGLNVLSQSDKDCVLANDSVTFGIQCDSLVMVVPHDQLVLKCTSHIGGRWNRQACGHMLIVDDFGGMSVNPDIPFGTGRLARVHFGRHYEGVKPGRVRPGEVDFSGTSDRQQLLSHAEPDWEISYYLTSGERLGISVFPPRPFPWAESFQFAWLLAKRKDPLDGYPRRVRGEHHVELLWDFFQRSWAMSWGPWHEPYDESLVHKHVAAIKAAGAAPIMYASPQWYYSRDAQEFAGELRRLRDTYGIEGIYYDGIPSQEWLVAYEEMRMTRELFPEGPVIVHNTGQCYNGNPPLGEPALRIPAVETYATATYAGELVYGEGPDWPFIQYSASQYRKANNIGVMKGDAWEGVTDLEKVLTMLLHNGRGQYRKYPREYFQVLQQLEELWKQHGDAPISTSATTFRPCNRRFESTASRADKYERDTSLRLA